MTQHGTLSSLPHAHSPAVEISGRATESGTARFADRFADSFAPGFYREAASLNVSSLGAGTYLGDCDDAEDARYSHVISAGFERGINFLDTAINYRGQRSERVVGNALRAAIQSGKVSRDEIVVSTKGGYVPLDGQLPSSREAYLDYLKTEYFDLGVMTRGDLVAGGHCISSGFLSNQISRSRANMGVDCIDIYYIHNPEQQLDSLDHARFLDAMRNAFVELEAQVARGRIGAYGCATWNGFRVFAANKNYLSLTELVALAREAGGPDHHFRAIQLPVNLAMTEAVRSPTQMVDGKNVDILSLARDLGISVVASASLMQSQLTQNLPAQVRTLFPDLDTDAKRAIAFVRSLPVSSALVGMRSFGHLTENLASALPPVIRPRVRRPIS